MADLVDGRRLSRLNMVEKELRQRGITDLRLLKAFEAVPRHTFIDSALRFQAYENQSLPIGLRQTISQPLSVAKIVEALRIHTDATVLDIGTGCGYQAAILSRLCKRVYTVERLPKLLRKAKSRFASLAYDNIIAKFDDGWQGWPEYGPFDAIAIAACGATVPERLIDQLKVGGRLVMPLGDENKQTLYLFHKQSESSISKEELGMCSFVPFVKNVAK